MEQQHRRSVLGALELDVEADAVAFDTPRFGHERERTAQSWDDVSADPDGSGYESRAEPPSTALASAMKSGSGRTRYSGPRA